MSKSNVFWWFILGGWMAASTWWHICKIKLLCDPVLYEPVRYQRPENQDSLLQALNFTFSALEAAPDSTLVTSRPHTDIFTPIDLQYNSGGVEYIKTPENEKFIATARQYLAANPEKKLLLTGHADNTGSEQINMRLSQNRAEHLKRQLTLAGLSAQQLLTDAKGQNAPKKSNSTADGRAANRRVAIVVQ